MTMLTPVEVMKSLGVCPGLMFRVTAVRLREHLKARSEYHARRAAEKRAEVPKLQEHIKGVQESVDRVKGFRKDSGVPVSNYNKASGGYGFNPDNNLSALEQQVDQLQSDVKGHEGKAATFAFLAESVFEAEYALTWADLVDLELAK